MISLLSAMTVTNQCCYCMTVFADRATTIRHMWRACEDGQGCRPEMNKWRYEITIPEALSCVLCGVLAPNPTHK